MIHTDPRSADAVHIAGDAIHVWTLPLDVAPARLMQLERVLNSDERLRAARFKFGRDRCRFMAARAFLRNVISRYTGQEPESLRFHYTRYGKPRLEAGSNGRDIHFNASASASMALVAVRRGAEVGVDVEWERPMSDMDAIGRRMFCPEEQLLLAGAAETERVQRFFRIWTCKEAVIKSVGLGLSLPIDSFSVRGVVADGSGTTVAQGDNAPHTQWVAVLPSPGPGFQSALASERSFDSVLHCRFETP
jgi:4'-phosphopantetheinyl transferase